MGGSTLARITIPFFTVAGRDGRAQRGRLAGDRPLEAKDSLPRMPVEIPLTDDERAAVDVTRSRSPG